MPHAPIQRKTHEIDAAGKPVGRLATHVARILIGKHKATYAPNVDAGDSVRVVNAAKLLLTGAKLDQKRYYHYSGYPGGLKTRKASDLMVKDPGRVLKAAVDRMLPKNTHRARRIKRLTIVK
jgi:large subunit ribosomal protein L13